MSYMNRKLQSLRKETILALDSPSGIIFTIGSINTLFADMNRKFLIADVDQVSPKIPLIVNLVRSLFLSLLLIQSLSSQ